MRAESMVADVLDRVYNDRGVRTPLDVRAAREVVGRLRDAGWVDLATLVAILDAAGISRVDIPRSALVAQDDKRRVLTYNDMNTGCLVLLLEPAASPPAEPKEQQ